MRVAERAPSGAVAVCPTVLEQQQVVRLRLRSKHSCGCRHFGSHERRQVPRGTRPSIEKLFISGGGRGWSPFINRRRDRIKLLIPLKTGQVVGRNRLRAVLYASLLAHILAAKYVDHLPFYRQSKRFGRDYG